MSLNLGRARDSNNGSQNSTLKSIKQIVEQSQFKGQKVDAAAINQILEAIKASQENSGKYALELASANNDALVEKIKDVINKLYEAQAADAEENQIESTNNIQQNDNAEILEKINEVSKHLQTTSDTTIQQLKEEFGTDEYQNHQEITKVGNFTSNNVATNFDILQNFINLQFKTLNDHFDQIKGINIKWFKLNFSNPFKSLSEKISGFKNGILEKIKSPFKSLSEKIGNFKTLISSKFSSLIKGIGGSIKNIVLSPFKLIGSFFSKINPFKSTDKFTFDRLEKFLKKFFMAKKVAKWLNKSLKFFTKIIQKFVVHIIKPIKKMLFEVVEKIGSIIHSVMTRLFIWLFPVIAVIWIIFGLLILAGIAIYKLYKWITKTAIPWIKNFSIKIWNGIKKSGKAIWKGIRFVFYDMWIILGKWVWRKLKQFGNWLWSKVKALGKWLKNTIVKPIIDWIKPKYDKYIKPIIDSINNLIIRIKAIWKNFNFDKNKSFIENLMLFWNNVKHSIKEWWSTSPFKTYYDKLVNWLKDMFKPITDWWNQSELKKNYDLYIQPLVDSLSDLKKAIFSAFSWDSSKSFFENLIGIWDNLKEKVTTWWSTSPFKTYYDKLVNWLSDITKPLIDWWNNLGISKTLNDIWEWVKNLATKVWEKIKGFFGGIGDIASAIWKKFKRILPSALGGESVDDSIKRLQKEIQEARDRGSSEKYIQKLQKELSESLGEQIDIYQEKIDKGDIVDKAWTPWGKDVDNRVLLNKFKAQKQELVSQGIIIEQPEIDNNELQLNESSQKAFTDELDKRFKIMMEFFTGPFSTIQTNFDLVLEKLDAKPNLLPIPMIDPSQGNMTLMEDR